MTSDDVLTLFRAEVADTALPYLWADEDVYGYIDDAQKMFCRWTDGIADVSSVFLQLNVTPGADGMSTDLSIKRYRGAWRLDNGKEIDLISREIMPSKGLRFDGQTGPVRRLVIGMEDGYLRVHPVSNETVSIQLSVFRMPVNDITPDLAPQDFEINPRHHRHLLLWVKHLAYNKQDTETLDVNKSEKFKQAFKDYCAEVVIEDHLKRHTGGAVAYEDY